MYDIFATSVIIFLIVVTSCGFMAVEWCNHHPNANGDTWRLLLKLELIFLILVIVFLFIILARQ